MILLNGFDIEGLNFIKDGLSDNAYTANIRITYRGRFRDVLETYYMPDEAGLVLIAPRLSYTFSFNEEDYNVGKYPKSEISEFCEYSGCEPDEAEDLISSIFEKAIEDYMDKK